MAHAWDAVHKWGLSRQMRRAVMAGFKYPLHHWLRPSDPRYWYDPGQGPPPCGVDALFNAAEDFAEAVAATVYPMIALEKATERGWPYVDTERGYSYINFLQTPRGQYIQRLIGEEK
jgi:hypothetical protein